MPDGRAEAAGGHRDPSLRRSGHVVRTLETFSDVVDWGLCIGCGACAYACKTGGVRMVNVEREGFRPVFDAPKSAECAQALPICPGYQVNGKLEIGHVAMSGEADHEFGPTL